MVFGGRKLVIVCFSFVFRLHYDSSGAQLVGYVMRLYFASSRFGEKNNFGDSLNSEKENESRMLLRHTIDAILTFSFPGFLVILPVGPLIEIEGNTEKSSVGFPFSFFSWNATRHCAHRPLY